MIFPQSIGRPVILGLDLPVILGLDPETLQKDKELDSASSAE